MNIFKNKKNLVYILITLSFPHFLSQQLNGQQGGQLSGTVSNHETGEPLIGVNVIVVGTPLGASTDLEGKYMIRKIPIGKYQVRASGIGYAPKTITDLMISDIPLELNFNMAEETYNLNEVVISADEIRSTETTVLAQRKRWASISDGISAEQIKKTPDATSGDALRRITGITVVENKFIFIRGITDRYNGTILDGAPVSSTSVGKKSFSYDMLPSNLLENTQVIKSATPDLPGDFSGGLVQLNTIDFPTNQVIKLNLSSSFNSITTADEILLSQGGKLDFLGFDDGIRKFPDKRENIQNALSSPNTWAPRSTSAPLNSSLSVSAGNRFDLGNNESRDQIGYIAALTYRNSYQHNKKMIDDWLVGRYNSGDKYENSVLWGFLGNVSYKYGGLHKISFKNNFDQSAEDMVTRYHSLDWGNYQEKNYTIVSWTQRSVYTGQLTGEHEFPALGGLSMLWRGSISSSTRQDPDRKEVTYYRNIDEPSELYRAAVNQRSWAKMDDRSVNFGIDITYPFPSLKIKIGSKTQRNISDYSIRYFNVVPDYSGGIPSGLVTLPLETIYSVQNYGPGKFLFVESSKASDSYSGDNKLNAGYLMFDIPFEIFENKFRFVGGTRIENSSIRAAIPKSRDPGSPVHETELSNTDILPSLNFAYLMNDITNVRFAYSHSVNRPEVRELASTAFYDFVKYEIVGGNPDLQRALIRNLDFRVEAFPGQGEVVAFSIFQKRISNAIEEQLVQTSTRTRTWFNSQKASNFGWELEVRKNMGFLAGYLSNLVITGNYTRIFSEVAYDENEGNSSGSVLVHKTRPLQGQAPYMINIGIFFTEPTFGTSLNVLYNTFGRRLETVGFLTADIYEEPRDILDLAVTQPITSSLEAKFTVKNLGNSERTLTQQNRTYEKTTLGRTYGVQLSYNL